MDLGWRVWRRHVWHFGWHSWLAELQHGVSSPVLILANWKDESGMNGWWFVWMT